MQKKKMKNLLFLKTTSVFALAFLAKPSGSLQLNLSSKSMLV